MSVNINKMAHMFENTEITDSNESLQILCSTAVNRNDDTSMRMRGVVVDKKTMNVVTRSLKYTETVTSETMKHEDVLYFPVSHYTAYMGFEGVLLRAFYHEKWYLATNRKLDAFHSKWAAKRSFGDKFVDYLVYKKKSERDVALKEFFDSLDTTKVYYFFMLNDNDGRIVCDAPEFPTVFTFGESVNDFESIPRAPDFNTVEELLNFVDNLNYKQYVGVFLTSEEQDVKICNDKYMKYFDVRGNVGSVMARYLAIRNEPETLKMFYELYPSYVPQCETYERTISKIVYLLLDVFERRLKREFVVVSPNKHKILKFCFDRFKQTRKPITHEYMRDLVCSQVLVSLNHLVREELFKPEQNDLEIDE